MQVNQVNYQNHKSNPSFQRLSIIDIRTEDSKLAADAVRLVLAAPPKRGQFNILKRAEIDDVAICASKDAPNHLSLEVQQNGVFKQKLLFFQNDVSPKELARTIRKVFTVIYQELAQLAKIKQVQDVDLNFYRPGVPQWETFANANASGLPS